MTQNEEHIAESGSLKDRIMATPHDGVLFRSVKKDFENREQMFSEILKKKLGIIFSVLHCVSMQYKLFSFVPAPKFELFSENVYFMSVTN